jgi:hypothetical protein
VVVAKTLRRTMLSLPGQLTRSAHRPRLHLCISAAASRLAWAAWFELALARLRCIDYAT